MMISTPVKMAGMQDSKPKYRICYPDPYLQRGQVRSACATGASASARPVHLEPWLQSAL